MIGYSGGIAIGIGGIIIEKAGGRILKNNLKLITYLTRFILPLPIFGKLKIGNGRMKRVKKNFM
ncbi:hypothetical protein [Candidatus Coxiella mudrowiae]|uniref:hypothetical protein n=1 Tax=Candidatus Coxiella mudrowiae TaxID=2054173 RepID=UPI0012FEDF5C|nr:hypothetical protein [Candidatus Coxiella mudrowiae]